MTLCLGLNSVTISNADLETGIRVANDAGASFYESRVPLLLLCEEREIRGRALSTLRESGLAWLPLNALEGLFELDLDDLLARADRLFALAERFSVTQVIIVPEKPSEEITLSISSDTLSCLVDRACPYGVALLYEAISFPSYALPNLTQAYVVVTDIGIPLVLGTFHLEVSRTDPQAIAPLPPRDSGLIHLSDGPDWGQSFREAYQ